ncbi:Uncharacterised protein [Escherichia coli]|uniref:Uncharacterized protein n=1 Tax=Escherichia coli TaxID=562 RepID=A0A447X967_ECOLX|nr:Uncharacterised protein [Escherichia coli]
MVLCPLGAVNQIFAGCGVNALSGLQRAILRHPLIQTIPLALEVGTYRWAKNENWSTKYQFD